jgi:hypothetical protein
MEPGQQSVTIRSTDRGLLRSRFPATDVVHRAQLSLCLVLILLAPAGPLSCSRFSRQSKLNCWVVDLCTTISEQLGGSYGARLKMSCKEFCN